MKRKSKVLSFVVCATLILSLVGCGANQGKQAASTGKTIRILKSKQPHEVPHDQMDVFKVLEEKTGVKVLWDNPPQENFTERYNIVMNSGDLPDMIIDMPSGDVFKYGQMGVIIALDDIIENYMPALKSWMDKNPDLKKGMKYADDKCYFLPFFDESPSGNGCLGIRKDWLDKVNLPVPVTIEDWYNVWKAFKSQDLNGKEDVIPFSGNGFGVARSLIQAWGVLDGFYLDPRDGGKVHYGPIEDRYKEAITWLHKMYAEGLIDNEIITNDEKAFQSKMAQNLVGSCRAGSGTYINFNATLPEKIPNFKIVTTPPIKGPYGEQLHTNLDRMPRNQVGGVITKSCKDPIMVAKWVDYFYSPEGALLINMGIEGKTYTMKDGVPVFTDYVLNNPDKLGPKNVLGRVSIGQSVGPYVFMKAQADSLDDAVIKYAKRYHIMPFIEESKKYILPSNLPFSSEDDNTRRQIMNEITTYVDEHVMLMVVGKEPISNWDTYVGKIKGMNIDKVVSIYQKAYDKWNTLD